MKKNKQKGLTLIEMLAVISIIAILFIILIPNISNSFDKAKVAGIQTDLKQYRDGGIISGNNFNSYSKEELNNYLDKDFQFHSSNLSKKENAYKQKYELYHIDSSQVLIRTSDSKNKKKYYYIHLFFENGEVKHAFNDIYENDFNIVDDEITTIANNSNNSNNNLDGNDSNSNENNSGGGSDVDGGNDGSNNNNNEQNLPDYSLTTDNIILSQNGNTSYEKEHNITVTVDKEHEEIQYVWSDSKVPPTTGWSETPSGSTISKSDGNGEQYLHINAIGKDGNSVHDVSDAFYFDNTPPTVKLTQNGSNTFAKNHSTQISVSDLLSGVGSIQYSWSDSKTSAGEYITVNNDDTISLGDVSGTKHLHIKTTDKAGNSFVFVSEGFSFDNTKPIINLSTNGSSTPSKTHSTKISSTDSHSSITKIRYAWNTNNSVKPTSWTETSNGTVTHSNVNGNFYLHVESYDVAGNVSYLVSNAFVFDNTLPLISLSTNGNSSYARSGSTIIYSSDAHSGLNKVEFSWSTNGSLPSTGWTTTSNGATVSIPSTTGTNYLHVRSFDKAGNNATFTSNAFLIDNTGPNLSLSQENSNVYYKDYQGVVYASDNHSGFSYVTYAWSDSQNFNSSTWYNAYNNSVITYTPSAGAASGWRYLFVRAVDNAGNITDKTYSFSFDLTKPYMEMNMDYDTINPNTGNADIVFGTPRDNHSGISSARYAWGSSMSVKPTSGWMYFSTTTRFIPPSNEMFRLHIELIDHVGNVSYLVY